MRCSTLSFGVTPAQAIAYRDGTEDFQRNFLNTVLAPLGPVTGSGNNYQSMFFAAAWMASPLDVCAAMSAMRQFNDRSPGPDDRPSPELGVGDGLPEKPLSASGTRAGVWATRQGSRS